MNSLFHFLLLLFAFPAFSLLPAQVLPSIGLNALPADSDSLCDAPWYLGSFSASGLQVGDTAADFTLYQLDSTPFNLASSLQQGKPALVVAGSYTCPVFRNKIATINDLVSTYGNALHVVVVYELEAHPDIDTSAYFGVPNPGNANIQAGILYRQPTTYGERKAIAQDMLLAHPINATLVMDGPCNEFWAHYGPAPQNAYLIDTNGIVFAKHPWFDQYPFDIYCDIDSLLGLPNSCGGTNNGTFTWNLLGSNTAYGVPGQTLYAYGEFVNNSTSPVEIAMVKDPEILPSDWSTSICTNVCYSPSNDSATFLLPAGATQSYTMYFYAGASPDTGRVRMRFENLNNPNNRFFQPFWGVTSVGTAMDGPVDGLLGIFPHPVKERARIVLPEGFGEMEKLVVELYNIQGKRVRAMEMEGGEMVFDRNGLPEGLYLYRVVEGENVIGQGKVLVGE